MKRKKEKDDDDRDKINRDKDQDPGYGKDRIVQDEIPFREVAIGKGLSGALNLLRDRGVLEQAAAASTSDNIIDQWGTGNGEINYEERFKDIGIERRDEFGRIIVDPREAFKLFCHQFHGIRPGKKKRDKRLRQYQQELKQIKDSSITSNSSSSAWAERFREVQARHQTPYFVLGSNAIQRQGN